MSTVDLLRRAADRLDALDRAALHGPWEAFGTRVAVPADGCTCGSPADASVNYAHEQGCGMEPAFEAPADDVALIAALRGTAAPLGDILRRAVRMAEYLAEPYTDEARPGFIEGHLSTVYVHEVDIARLVLGEPS